MALGPGEKVLEKAGAKARARKAKAKPEKEKETERADGAVGAKVMGKRAKEKAQGPSLGNAGHVVETTTRQIAPKRERGKVSPKERTVSALRSEVSQVP